ncbi:hypothetical protein [Hafnia psychrotolerans]|nr:hypothetical protein [Hafnia psychrotolerans]
MANSSPILWKILGWMVLLSMRGLCTINLLTLSLTTANVPVI